MPRNGSGIYSTPPGTHGIPDTTIMSTPYNTNVDDVAQDLNTPRPIVAGGTNATTVDGALNNLQAEKRQQVVDNFDSFSWTAGSWCAGGNTPGAPVPQSAGYYGEATLYTDSSYMLVKAYENGTGIEHRRLKVNGAWGAWMTLDNVNNKVNRAGDTMTGTLNINQSAATWTATINGGGSSNGLYVGAGSSGNQTVFQVNDAAGTNNWFFISGTGNGAWGAGQFDYNGPLHTNVSINATAPAGAWPVVINGNGAANQSYGLMINAGSSASDISLLCRNSSGGSNLFIVYGNGAITCNGYTTINSGITVTTGADITGKVWHRGTNPGDWGSIFQAPGYGLLLNAGDATTTSFQVSNAAQSVVLFYVKGDGSAQVAGPFGVGGAQSIGSNLQIGGQGYKPGGGSWADSSDARIKNVLGGYTSGLEEVLALEPVIYQYKGNDERINAVGVRTPVHQIVANNGQQFIGLVAQEAERVMPELVSQQAGYIDGEPVSDIRNIDATPLVYALVNAVKQLAARVEALEGK